MLSRRTQPAFSLAELLIALAILGVIATFTIPKILHSQQSSKKRAILQETLSTLAALTAEAWQTGELRKGSNGLYILRKMNVVKLCDTSADAEACWPVSHPMLGGAMEQNEPGAVLHNGATLGGFNDEAASTYNWVFVDWNGPEPPNEEGEDQLKLMLCYDPSGVCGGPGNRSGTVRPLFGWESEALYQEVFGHK